MKTLTVIMIAMILWACAAPASGHDGSGGTSLEPRPSVRALALGETGPADIGDAAGFGANPAVLTWLPGAGAALSHGGLVEGISSSAISVCAAIPLGSEVALPDAGSVGRRFGLGFRLDHSAVELSRGTDWGRDLVSVGAAYRITPYASAGVTGKYLFTNSDLEGSAVQAFGLDLGAFVEMSSTLGLAVTLRNIYGTARWEDGEDETPPLAGGLGARLLLPYGVSARFAVTFSAAAQAQLGLGADAPVAGTGFSLRGGYLRHSGDYSRNVITAGFGYRYGAFGVDYAVKVDDELALGTTHHFSFGYAPR